MNPFGDELVFDPGFVRGIQPWRINIVEFSLTDKYCIINVVLSCK